MTVWIVNPFDNLPLEGFRPQRYWLMARAFARAGHRVTLFSSTFSHALKRARDVGATERVLETLRAEGFRLVLVPTPAYPRNVCLARIRSHRAFAANWTRSAARLGEKPDAVIASLPPLGAADAACAWAHAHGARFVLDVMDAWPETFYRLGPRFLFAPLRRLARRLYRAADAVTAVAPRYLDLARAYGSDVPAHLCLHGIEMPREAPPPRAPGAPARLVYAGNMGRSYDLATVIDGVRARADVTLDLAGTGPCEEALRRRAAGCDRIRFHGYCAADALRALLAAADAGVVPLFPDACVGIPYKLADYAAAGLRVVSSLPGETADLLARFHAGATYRAGDAASFLEALDALARDEGFDAAAFRAPFDADRLYRDYVSFVTSAMKMGQQT